MNLHDVEILLVEDNPRDVELTLRALKKYNFLNKIFVVEDGAAALDFLFGTGSFVGRRKTNLKVVLLDLKLPKIDGIEVLRRIKVDPRTSNIPVVVLTSSHENQDIDECYRLGVNSYVVKPVEFDKFAQTVAELGFYWMLVNKPLP